MLVVERMVGIAKVQWSWSWDMPVLTTYSTHPVKVEAPFAQGDSGSGVDMVRVDVEQGRATIAAQLSTLDPLALRSALSRGWRPVA